MTVTYDIQPIDQLATKVNFSSDEATPVTFRVYVNGVLVRTSVSATGSDSVILTLAANETSFIEVLDLACQTPEIAFPGSLSLNWEGVPGAASYRIDEYFESAWTERQNVVDQGQGAFVFKSRFLEDVTTHQFRIVPIDASGSEGTALEFAVLMVRHPDNPVVSYAYDGDTATVTIS